MSFEKPVYPFSAIVNQRKMKLALILNAIDPTIGGVLLSGPKGTGKSLTARALSKVLPEVKVVEDCVFNCSPYDPTNMCDSCRSRFKSNALPVMNRKMRFVQIPIGATEDMVIGTLDVETALQQGKRSLQPGLLAKANQGILYIDEVNLLPDHLVDVILDAASSGWNIVEREGLSVTHPSRFILIGSMNPEEGELRPQILDRFSLHAKAESIKQVKDRMEVVRANNNFGRNPMDFHAKYREQELEVINRIATAKKLLPRVNTPLNILESIAKICTDLKVDGYRPDIVMVKAAKAHGALNGRSEIILEDVLAASEFTLTHRTRKSGLVAPPSPQEIHDALETTPIGKDSRTRKDRLISLVSGETLKKTFAKPFRDSPVKVLTKFAPLIVLLLILFSALTLVTLPLSLDFPNFLIITSFIVLSLLLFHRRGPRKKAVISLLDFSKITSEQTSGPQTLIEDDDERSMVHYDIDYHGKSSPESGSHSLQSTTAPKESEMMKPPKLPQTSQEERTRQGKYYLVGKRAKVVASSSRGRYVWHEIPKERPSDIAFGPTIRAAAPFQLSREQPGLAVSIEPEDLRVKKREYRAPFSIILLVDMSLSMATSIVNLGRAIFSLHRSVYRRRDRVGLIVFKGSEAIVLQQPTTNLDLIVQKLWKVGTSDLTPMPAGMLKAWKVLKLERQRNKDVVPMLIIVSDGIANVRLSRPLSKHVRSRSVDRLLSDAQADVFDVARLLVRDGVRVIVLNTAHKQEELAIRKEMKQVPRYARWYLPTEFLMELARVSGGSYYGLTLKKEGALVKGTKLEQWFYVE